MSEEEHAVIVSIKLSDDEWGSAEDARLCEELDERIMEAVDQSHAGMYDGMGRGLGVFEVYTYGPDARVLADVILPVLRTTPVRAGSFLTLRSGPPGAPESRIEL